MEDEGTPFERELRELAAEYGEEVSDDDDGCTAVTGDGHLRKRTIRLRLPMSMLAAVMHETPLPDADATARVLKFAADHEPETFNVLVSFLDWHSHREPDGQ